MKAAGEAYLSLRPSKKSIRRRVEKVHALTDLKTVWQETTEVVGKLNRALRGWANYFQVGSTARAYRAVDNYTAPRLRRWLRNKHKLRRRRGETYLLSYLCGPLGHRQTKGAATDKPDLLTPRHISTRPAAGLLELEVGSADLALELAHRPANDRVCRVWPVAGAGHWQFASNLLGQAARRRLGGKVVALAARKTGARWLLMTWDRADADAFRCSFRSLADPSRHPDFSDLRLGV